MKNFIIIIDGPMGSGKSTVGDLIRKKLKRTAVINIDKIKWFVSDFKRNKKDNAITGAVVMAMCQEYLKQGVNLIIPQGFWKGKKMLDPFIGLSKKMRANLYLYHLDAPHKILYSRVQGRPKPEKPKTPITKTRMIRNIRNWKKYRYNHGKEFLTHKISAEAVAHEVLEDLKERKYIVK